MLRASPNFVPMRVENTDSDTIGCHGASSPPLTSDPDNLRRRTVKEMMVVVCAKHNTEDK